MGQPATNQTIYEALLVIKEDVGHIKGQLEAVHRDIAATRSEATGATAKLEIRVTALETRPLAENAEQSRRWHERMMNFGAAALMSLATYLAANHPSRWPL